MNCPHALLVCAALMLGVWVHEVLPTLLGLVGTEALAVAFLPRVRWVRRLIDKQIEARARAESAAARMQRLQRMGDDHRRELVELETVARTIQEHPSTSVRDCVTIERLLDLYIRLAIARRAMAGLVETAGRPLPEDAVADLERRISISDGRVRGALQHRLSVLRRRCGARRAARDEQNALDAELATISDAVRGLQEGLAALPDRSLLAELRDALGSAEPEIEGGLERVATRIETVDAVTRIALQPAEGAPGAPVPANGQAGDSRDASGHVITAGYPAPWASMAR